MSSDERRAEIVRATLPLLVEHGANISTRQIARAANVAEGTVFRVFTDKDALLRACVTEAFRTDDLCARIRAVSTAEDIETRLIEAGLLFLAHITHLGELKRNLTASDYDLHRHGPGSTDHTAHEGAMRFMHELTDAIGTLLVADRQRFRTPIEDAARMFLGLLMSLRFDPNAREDERAGIAQRVDVLLRGVLAQ